MYTITIVGVNEHPLAKKLLGDFVRSLIKQGGVIASAEVVWGDANKQAERYIPGGNFPKAWGDAAAAAPIFLDDHPHSDTANLDELLLDSGALDLTAKRIAQPGVLTKNADHLTPDKAVVFTARRDGKAEGVSDPAKGPTIEKQAYDAAEKAIADREAAEAEKAQKEELAKQQAAAEKEILAARKTSEKGADKQAGDDAAETAKADKAEREAVAKREKERKEAEAKLGKRTPARR